MTRGSSDASSRKNQPPTGAVVSRDGLPAIVGAAVADLVSLVTWAPGASLIGKAFESLAQQRLERARETLFAELRKGQISLADPSAGIDEFVRITHAYFRAADEGAAQRNLRILAQIAAGQAFKDALNSADFLSWTAILATLTREELIVLGSVVRVVGPKFEMLRPATGETWIAADAVAEICVPEHIPVREEVESCLSSLPRTGLLLTSSVWGGTGYWPAPRLRRLIGLIGIDGLGDGQVP